MAVDPRDLDEAIEQLFAARFGGGVRAANEAAAAEHLARRFTDGPKLSTGLWGEGEAQREAIIDHLRREYRAGRSIGETPGYPKNRTLSQLRAWYTQGPSEGMRGDPTYVARRLAVTESAFYFQALDNAIDGKLEAAGMIDGYEVLLAPEREEWDCDCRAVSEAGPYPTMDETPELPRHPNCMCRRRPIILGEKSEERKAEERAGLQAVKNIAVGVVKWTAAEFAREFAKELVEYAVKAAARYLSALYGQIMTTERGALMRAMSDALRVHYVNLARERMRHLFKKPKVYEATFGASPGPRSLPSSAALDESTQELVRLTGEARTVIPRGQLPVPMTVSQVLADPEFDRLVRELLKEAWKNAKPVEGALIYKPGATWTKAEIIEKVFGRGAALKHFGEDALTAWAKPLAKPAKPGKPSDVTIGGDGAKPVVMRVHPVTAIDVSELGMPEVDAILQPGANLRPFAVNDVKGEWVIDFREMPSWANPVDFADDAVLKFVPPMGVIPDAEVVSIYRELFPMPPEQLRKHLMFGIDATVTRFDVTATGTRDLVVTLKTDKFDSTRRFRRTDQGVEVVHTGFHVEPAYRGQGIGREALVNSVYLYESLGYRQVSLVASGERGDVGSYVWARFGFTPSTTPSMYLAFPDQWERLVIERIKPWFAGTHSTLSQADRLFIEGIIADPSPRAIWRLAEHPLGRDVLIGPHSSWIGALDLTDEVGMRRFNAYTRRLPLVQRAAEIEEAQTIVGMFSYAPQRPAGWLDSHVEIGRDIEARMHPLFDGPLGRMPVPHDLPELWERTFGPGVLPSQIFAAFDRLIAPNGSLAGVFGETLRGGDARRIVYAGHDRVAGYESIGLAIIDPAGKVELTLRFEPRLGADYGGGVNPDRLEIVVKIPDTFSQQDIAITTLGLEEFAGFLGERVLAVTFTASAEQVPFALQAGLNFVYGAGREPLLAALGSFAADLSTPNHLRQLVRGYLADPREPEKLHVLLRNIFTLMPDLQLADYGYVAGTVQLRAPITTEGRSQLIVRAGIGRLDDIGQAETILQGTGQLMLEAGARQMPTTRGLSLLPPTSELPRGVRRILESDRYDVLDVVRHDTGHGPRMEITYGLRGTDTWATVETAIRTDDTWRTRGIFRYDAEIARPVMVETGDLRDYRYDLADGWVRGVDALDGVARDGFMYRGMSWDEWVWANRTGVIQSRGDLNIGAVQQDLTFYSSVPGEARSYASAFAPLDFRPTPTRPGIVIEVPARSPSEVRGTGVGETEIGVREAIPISEVTRVWEGRPYLTTTGTQDMLPPDPRYTRQEWEAGSGSGPSMDFAWRELDLADVRRPGLPTEFGLTPPAPTVPLPPLAPGEIQQLPLLPEHMYLTIGRPTPEALTHMRREWGVRPSRPDEWEMVFGGPPDTDELANWDAVMRMTPVQFAEHFRVYAPTELVGKHSWSVSIHDDESLTLILRTDGDKVRVSEMKRDINVASGEAYHNLFIIERTGDAGRGLGKALFEGMVEIYQHIGIGTINAQAGLSAGGYVWPRMGYLADSGKAQDLASEFLEHIGTIPWDDAVRDIVAADRADYLARATERVMVDDGYQDRINEALAQGDDVLANRIGGEADDWIDKYIDEMMDQDIYDMIRDTDAADAYFEDVANRGGLTLYNQDEPQLLWQIADHPDGRSFLAMRAYDIYLDLGDHDQYSRLMRYVDGTLDKILNEAEAIAGAAGVQYTLAAERLQLAAGANFAPTVMDDYQRITRDLVPRASVPTPAGVDAAEFEYVLDALMGANPHSEITALATQAEAALAASRALGGISPLDVHRRMLSLPGMPPQAQLTSQPFVFGTTERGLDLQLGRTAMIAVPTKEGEALAAQFGVGFRVQVGDTGRHFEIALQGHPAYGTSPQEAMQMIGDLFHRVNPLVQPGEAIRLRLQPHIFGELTDAEVAHQAQTLTKAAATRDSAIGTLMDMLTFEARDVQGYGLDRAQEAVVRQRETLYEMTHAANNTRKAGEAIIRLDSIGIPLGTTLEANSVALNQIVTSLRRENQYRLLGRWMRGWTTDDVEFLNAMHLRLDPKVAAARLPGKGAQPFQLMGEAHRGMREITSASIMVAQSLGLPTTAAVSRNLLPPSLIIQKDLIPLEGRMTGTIENLTDVVREAFVIHPNPAFGDQELNRAVEALRRHFSGVDAGIPLERAYDLGIVAADTPIGHPTLEMLVSTTGQPAGPLRMSITGKPLRGDNLVDTERRVFFDGPALAATNPLDLMHAQKAIVDALHTLDVARGRGDFILELTARTPEQLVQHMSAFKVMPKDDAIAQRLIDELTHVAKTVQASGQWVGSTYERGLDRLVQILEATGTPVDKLMTWRDRQMLGQGAIQVYRTALRRVAAELLADPATRKTGIALSAHGARTSYASSWDLPYAKTYLELREEALLRPPRTDPDLMLRGWAGDEIPLLTFPETIVGALKYDARGGVLEAALPRPVREAFPVARVVTDPTKLERADFGRVYTTDELRLEGLGDLIDRFQKDLGIPIVGVDRVPPNRNAADIHDSLLVDLFGTRDLSANERAALSTHMYPHEAMATTLFTYDVPKGTTSVRGMIINLTEVKVHEAWNKTQKALGKRKKYGETPWGASLDTYSGVAPTRRFPMGRPSMDGTAMTPILHDLGHVELMDAVMRGVRQVDEIPGLAPLPKPSVIDFRAGYAVSDLIEIMDEVQLMTQDAARAVIPSDYMYENIMAAKDNPNFRMIAVNEMAAEAYGFMMTDAARFAREYPRLAEATEKLRNISADIIGKPRFEWPAPGSVQRAAKQYGYPEAGQVAVDTGALMTSAPATGPPVADAIVKAASASLGNLTDDVVEALKERLAKIRFPWSGGGTLKSAATQDSLAFERFFTKLAGQFGQHIDQSIPNYAPNRIATAKAFATMLPKGGKVIDVGASEGQLGQAIGLATGGKTRVLNVDPNPNMRDAWQKEWSAPGNEYQVAAFVEGFYDDHNLLDVPAFRPTGDADVIHMSMVRQFVTDDADAWYLEAKRALKRDGIFVNNVKVIADPNDAEWAMRESQKDSYKRQFFTQDQITRKAEETLVGMHQLMLTKDQELAALRKHFKHVVVYWESYNFYGFVAGDDMRTITRFLEAHAISYQPTYTPFRPATNPYAIGTLESKAPTGQLAPLYHGTNIHAALAIETGGLLPLAGDLTRDAYESFPGERLPGAIFFAPQERLGMALHAMLDGVRRRLQAAMPELTFLDEYRTFIKQVMLDDLREHGALIISREYDPDATFVRKGNKVTSLSGEPFKGELPPQVENLDVFTLVPARATDVLTGDRLIEWLAELPLVKPDAEGAWRSFVMGGIPLPPDLEMDHFVFEAFERMGLYDAAYQASPSVLGGALDYRIKGWAQDTEVISQRVVERTLEKGGVTYSPMHDHYHEGGGYAVAIGKQFEVAVPLADFSAGSIQGYIDLYKGEFTNEFVHLGTWNSKREGIVYLDMSELRFDLTEAFQVAKDRLQIAIYDFDKKQEIYLADFPDIVGLLQSRRPGMAPNEVLFPLELLPAPPIIVPPTWVEGVLPVVILAPHDAIASFLGGATGFDPTSTALVPTLLNEYQHAYLVRVPQSRVLQASAGMSDLTTAIMRGYEAVRWPDGRVELLSRRPAELLGKLDTSRLVTLQADALFAHVLDTRGHAAHVRVPIHPRVTWADDGWRLEGGDDALRHAYASGANSLRVSVDAPEERIVEALQTYSVPQATATTLSPGGPLRDLATEIRADALVYEELLAAMRQVGVPAAEVRRLEGPEARQLFALKRAIERVGMAIPADLTPAGVLVVEPRAGTRLLAPASALALRPQLAELLPAELGAYVSDALAVARLGFQGIANPAGNAILDETALPLEPHSTALIAGTTRALERIRLENPNVAFSYVTYVPTRRK